MNKEQLNEIIKSALDKHLKLMCFPLDEDDPFDGDYYWVCDNKDKLQNDLVETLEIFLNDK